MKNVRLMAGGVVLGLVLLLLVLRVVGLDPRDYHPGLWLTGEVAPTRADWSSVPKNGLTAVQSREWFFPPLAHSVTTAYTVLNNTLYVPSLYPAGLEFPVVKHWNRNVAHDPRVRIKLNNKLYDVVMVRVTEPAEYDMIRQWFITRSPDLGSPGLHYSFFRVETDGGAKGTR